MQPSRECNQYPSILEQPFNPDSYSPLFNWAIATGNIPSAFQHKWGSYLLCDPHTCMQIFPSIIISSSDTVNSHDVQQRLWGSLFSQRIILFSETCLHGHLAYRSALGGEWSSTTEECVHTEGSFGWQVGNGWGECQKIVWTESGY